MNRPTLGLLLGAACALGACSYNLDALRHDAGTDLGVDVPPSGTCTRAEGIANAREVGTMYGPSVVVTGDTIGRPSQLLPSAVGDECTNSSFSQPAPEFVYRYVMQAGTRLYATTTVPPCGTWLDTVVSISTGCDPDGGTLLACNDDDHLLSACPTSGAGYIPTLSSSTVADGLVPGQTVYVVVDSYNGQVGTFRLALTENGAPNAEPPVRTDGGGVAPANRCGCPSRTDLAALARIEFPNATDTAMPADGKLRAEGDAISGTRAVALTRAAGAALETTLAANGISTNAGCENAEAVVDLLLNGLAAQSFKITARTPSNAPLRVAFQTFAPITLADPPAVPIALRLRSITPAGCGYVEFDRTRPGTLSVFGEPPT